MSEPQDMIDSLGLTMTAQYQKQDKLPDNRDEWQMRWLVTIINAGGVKYQTPYFQGIGHHPQHKDRLSIADDEVFRESMRTGFLCRWSDELNHAMTTTRPIPSPIIADVLCCLVMDSSALYQSFSDWCDEFGYDDDSMSAKKTYDACCDEARGLISLVGADGLRKLQVAFQDY